MKYTIEVNEQLTRQIEVEVDDESCALDIVKQRYKEEEIVLDESDFIDVKFKVINE